MKKTVTRANWLASQNVFRAAFLTIPWLVFAIFSSHAHGQHQHGDDTEKKAPRVFLDKSRKIVDFQLKRLDNQLLLLVERGDDDPKFLPVHEAILKREGIASGEREKAIAAIVKINGTDAVTERLNLLKSLDLQVDSQRRVGAQIAKELLSDPAEALSQNQDKFSELVSSENPLLRQIGFGGLLSIGNPSSLAAARSLAQDSDPKLASLLESVSLVASEDTRNRFRDLIVPSLDSPNLNVKRQAIKALKFITENAEANFAAAAKSIGDEKLRRDVIRTLASIDPKKRPSEVATKLVDYLVGYAEGTPAADRTTTPFLEAMQFTDQLLGLVDQAKAREYRDRLDQVTVRVVLMHTVEEEMRYDLPWFAVEAGREFQVVLQNDDLMPHNLVFTKPGKLEDIALAAAAIGPTIGESGKQYVPVSDDVIAATEMVPSQGQARLTFKAPSAAGEYPYVCTFPGHWMRMYGVMVVVDDLAAFQRNPTEPKDPVGSNRAFVKAWKLSDFEGKIDAGLRGRTHAIGEKIFQEATCATCHLVAGKGKAVGPDLTEVWNRWKGDSSGVLREILEPSHKIDPKYVVRKIVTADGLVVSGIVISEDKDKISILPNSESIEPTVIAVDEIDDMLDSSVSIMPKALMDRFTEDEIFELLAYLRDAESKK